MRFQPLISNILIENQKLEMAKCFTYVGNRIKNDRKKHIFFLYNVLKIILNAILKWKKGVKYI